jgi:hypothetical protein
MRNPFGWDYPAGAEHDPRAPWNQRDEPDELDTDSSDGDGKEPGQ